MRVRILIICFALCIASRAEAKNFRWSSQGDAATLDPHSQNETFNNGINGLVYEYLVNRDRQTFSKFVPGLALSWTNTGPLTWVFKLRQGVKFHDGTPFTADDVVFSFNRARNSTVTFRLYSTQSGIAKRLDDYTVEFTTPVPNPVMLDDINTIMIMSKAWSEKNGVSKPLKTPRKKSLTRREMPWAPAPTGWWRGSRASRSRTRRILIGGESRRVFTPAISRPSTIGQ